MVYVVEILPYSMRAKGIALFWLATGVSGTVNTYVNPLGIAAFGWKFYFFYVAWIAVEFIVVYWQCPETMGVSLEDVALLIDGKDATVSNTKPVVEALAREKAEDGITVVHEEQLDKSF